MNIELREINMANFKDCLKLELNEEQKNFMASNMFSLAEAAADKVSCPMAIYSDETMVGFVMYDYDPATKSGWITRLMVDYRYQGKGYGKYAINEVINRFKATDGCEFIKTSYVLKNKRAGRLYKSLGFNETGELIDGEKLCLIKIEKDAKNDINEYVLKQAELVMEKKVLRTLKLKYLLYLPKNYELLGKIPLVMFLHGAGERGDNIDKVKLWGPPHLVEEGREFPFILVSPQCPSEMWWDSKMDDLYELLKDIKGRYPVDSERIYLTGLSMGGYGTWEMAISYPDEFAAAIPLCGGVLRKRFLWKIKDLPIWAFHGVKDQTVLVSETTDAVDSLKKLGSDIKLTLYPEGEHNIQTETYNNPELYKWMLAQRRKK